jgi:hypothetical protein
MESRSSLFEEISDGAQAVYLERSSVFIFVFLHQSYGGAITSIKGNGERSGSYSSAGASSASSSWSTLSSSH